jgi:molybdopterin converting factor small subunit
MQEISPNRFAGIIETNDALITGVRGFVRSIVLRQDQHERPFNLFHDGLSNFFGRMNKALFLIPSASLVSRHEVAIMYFGRTSEFLMMTSERMVIPTGRYTLGQLLSSLYKRGDRWVDELDDSHLICTVNGRDARLFDPIAPGAEICISSKKSISEA